MFESIKSSSSTIHNAINSTTKNENHDISNADEIYIPLAEPTTVLTNNISSDVSGFISLCNSTGEQFKRVFTSCIKGIPKHSQILFPVVYNAIKDFTTAYLQRSHAIKKEPNTILNDTSIALGAMFIFFILKNIFDYIRNYYSNSRSPDSKAALLKAAQDLVNIASITTTIDPAWTKLMADINGTSINNLQKNTDIETFLAFFATASAKGLTSSTVNSIGNGIIECCTTWKLPGKNKNVQSIITFLYNFMQILSANLVYFYIFGLVTQENEDPIKTAACVLAATSFFNTLFTSIKIYLNNFKVEDGRFPRAMENTI